MLQLSIIFVVVVMFPVPEYFSHHCRWQAVKFRPMLAAYSKEGHSSCYTCYKMGLLFIGLSRWSTPTELPFKTSKGYWGPSLTRIPTRDTHHAVLGCYRVHGKPVWTRRTIHRLFQNQRILFLFSWNPTVISQWESSARFWYQNKELLLKPTRVLPVRFRLSNSSGNFYEKSINQKVSFI